MIRADSSRATASGSSAYNGSCGGSAPACQVTNLAVYDDAGTPTVEGTIFCQGLAGPTGSIEVTQIGSLPGTESMPGRFRVANCPGLVL